MWSDHQLVHPFHKPFYQLGTSVDVVMPCNDLALEYLLRRVGVASPLSSPQFRFVDGRWSRFVLCRVSFAVFEPTTWVVVATAETVFRGGFFPPLFLFTTWGLKHIPGGPKTINLMVFPIRPLFYNRDLQSTIPGDYYFDGLWLAGHILFNIIFSIGWFNHQLIIQKLNSEILEQSQNAAKGKGPIVFPSHHFFRGFCCDCSGGVIFCPRDSCQNITKHSFSIIS